jgi:hypothetical protein
MPSCPAELSPHTYTWPCEWALMAAPCARPAADGRGLVGSRHWQLRLNEQLAKPGSLAQAGSWQKMVHIILCFISMAPLVSVTVWLPSIKSSQLT